MGMTSNLSSREKTVLVYAIPLAILIAGYAYLWQPVRENLDRLKQSVPLKTMELAWMKYELDQAEPWLSGASEDGSNSPILTIIDRRANASGVKSAIQRVQPGDSGQVKLWFEDVPADNWLKFVNTLSIDGIAVHTATMTRRSDGLVNARITVAR
jgi:type II secretory pathway component PulM